MMKITNRWMILLLLAAAGCSSQAGAEDTAEADVVEEAGLFTKGDKEEKQTDDMQLTLTGASYPFTTKDYPILSRYIQSDQQPEKLLNALPFSKINEHQYLVEFACHKKRCSHLMIDFEQKHSFLMSDLSELVGQQMSPDRQYTAFLFERNYEGASKHQLVVMNLDTLEPAELEPGGEHLLAKPNQYQYGIHSVTFMDGERIQITSDDPTDIESKELVRTQWIYK